MMTEVTEQQVDPVVTTQELQRDATTMVEDMIQHVSSLREKLDGAEGKKAEQLRRETGRLLNSLEASRPGVVDLCVFLNKQPKEDEFQYPQRVDVLLPEARRRMEKSKYMFPEPRSVVQAVAILADEADVAELRHRVAHYLSRMNMVQDGLAASTACRRLLQAAGVATAIAAGKAMPQEQIDILAAAKASLGSFLYEARRRGRS